MFGNTFLDNERKLIPLFMVHNGTHNLSNKYCTCSVIYSWSVKYRYLNLTFIRNSKCSSHYITFPLHIYIHAHFREIFIFAKNWRFWCPVALMALSRFGKRHLNELGINALVNLFIYLFNVC